MFCYTRNRIILNIFEFIILSIYYIINFRYSQAVLGCIINIMKGLNKNVKIAKATIFFIFDVICLIILSSGILASPPSFFYLQRSYAETPLCIDFIALNTTIRLNCGSATLSRYLRCI